MMTNLIKISKSQIKNLSKLSIKKYRDLEGKFLVEGKRAVNEALNSNWKIESILIKEDDDINKFFQAQIDLANKKGIPCFLVQSKDFDKISNTMNSQGIIALVKKRSLNFNQILQLDLKKSCVVALDRISDPGNLGSIIRICDWFAVDAILISKESADLYNSKVVRSTMGSIFHQNIVEDLDLISALTELRKTGFRIYSTVLNGKNVYKMHFDHKSVIIFGSEAQGISENLIKFSDENITIPKFGNAESLNVASATAIILSVYKSKTIAVS